MKKMTHVIWLLFVAVILTGCATLREAEKPQAAELEPPPVVEPQDETVVLNYAAGKGISVQVTFESQKAYDAVQLGLLLLTGNEDGETEVTVDSDAFFPRYFAMVNLDIEEGLLLISDEEASRFAVAAYLKYQEKVTSKELLEGVRKPRVLGEIVKPKS